MTTTIPNPCDVTTRALAAGHESACGCPLCVRHEAARRLAWMAKHANSLEGYSPLADIETGGTPPPTDARPEQADARLHLEVKADRDGVIEGYGSVFGTTDTHGDVVMPGAFARSLLARTPAMLWQHRYDDPVGNWQLVREDERGLFVRGLITLAAFSGRNAFALIQSGACTGLSIGFRTIKATWDDAAKVRRLTDLDLYEVSFVTFPSNLDARVLSTRGGTPQPAPAADTGLRVRLDELAAKAASLRQSFDELDRSDLRAVAARVSAAEARIAARARKRTTPSPAMTRQAAQAQSAGMAWHRRAEW